MSFSVNALFYGDFMQLAERCMESLIALAQASQIADLRIGLNAVSQPVREYITASVLDVPAAVYLFDAPRNVYKYPMMKRMFQHEPTSAVHTMWFDDDSYLHDQWLKCPESADRFFSYIADKMASTKSAVLGEPWFRVLMPGQAEWIRSKPWFKNVPFIRRRNADWITFVTGGFWAILTEVLRKYDWPDAEIAHCGGDTMLGELLHQQGYETYSTRKEPLVHINKAERRGFSEKPAGTFNRVPLRVDAIHKFEAAITKFDGRS